MEYFIIENGQQAGPFSTQQLALKRISPQTLVWKQGMADWTPAGKVEDLKQVLDDIAAIPADSAAGPQVPPVPPVNPMAQEQPAPAPEQPKPQKKKNRGKWIVRIVAAVIVIVLLVLAFTNPGEEDHKKAVRREVTATVERLTETQEQNIFTQGIQAFASMMANNLMGNALNELFEYHNYILFSKGTVDLNDTTHSISFGILGKVYTVNSDDMLKAIEKSGLLNIQESTTTTEEPADQQPTDGDAASQQQDDSTTDDISQQLEDKANETVDKLSDKVKKKVREKINKKIDEITDSSTVDKVLDKILGLF